jgi:chromate transport protein ChrA
MQAGAGGDSQKSFVSQSGVRRSLTWLSAMPVLGLALWLAAGWERPVAVNDFVEYWAASRQLLAGENPYAPAQMLDRERTAGFTGAPPLMMRNPPWVFPFTLPFGALPFALGQRLWFGLGMVSVLISIQLLWRLYASEKLHYRLIWLTTATFLPVATVLAVGQITPLVLLGVAGFLHCQHKRRDSSAGAFALLIAIKPHLAFLFWPALLLWALQERRWRTLLGLVGAGFVASATSLAFHSAVFSEYLVYWKEGDILSELIPTLGGVLRLFFGLQKHWLEFIPAIVAGVWFLFHWLRHRHHWNWLEQMPLLLLVSVATTPLSWFFDQVVLLPCVLQATVWIAMRGKSEPWPVSLYLGMNAVMLGLILTHRTTFWYAWTAPAWLVVYLAAGFLARSGRSASRPLSVSA